MIQRRDESSQRQAGDFALVWLPPAATPRRCGMEADDTEQDEETREWTDEHLPVGISLALRLGASRAF